MSKHPWGRVRLVYLSQMDKWPEGWVEGGWRVYRWTLRRKQAIHILLFRDRLEAGNPLKLRTALPSERP